MYMYIRSHFGSRSRALRGGLGFTGTSNAQNRALSTTTFAGRPMASGRPDCRHAAPAAALSLQLVKFIPLRHRKTPVGDHPPFGMLKFQRMLALLP